MLALEKLLQGLAISVEPFALCCAGSGQRLAMAKTNDATLHYVLAGAGTLIIERDPVELQEGTMIIVPANRRQELVGHDSTDSKLEYAARCQTLTMGVESLAVRIDTAGGVAMTCGAIKATYQQLHGVFDYLPTPIVEQAQRNEPLRSAFTALLQEMVSPQPGGDAMLRALMQQCLILLLRQYCTSGHCQLPWLTALEEPRLGKVVTEIVEHPGRFYTLELLAEQAHMSRSTFAERFSKTFGRTPMDFVREVRLRQAAQWLVNTDRTIVTIATQLGYDSRSHFSRAFRAFFGEAPSQYRASRTLDIGRK